jgi:hydroxyacylglutathione hydrolase
MDIHRRPALSTNYIFVLHDSQNHQAVVIDPGDAEPVFELLRELKAKPVAIWHTHHHRDHIGGNRQLLNAFPDLKVYASPVDQKLDRVPGQNHCISAGDRMTFGDRVAEVLFIPGHTLGHIGYYFPPDGDGEAGHLFCGDTLFSGGCGRLFEGTPAQMVASLSQIRALPDQTWIWCSHEYTLTNLKFALSVDPDNKALQERYAEVQLLRDRNLPTIPSLLAIEKQTNPFLRWDQPAIQTVTSCDSSIQTFARLRGMRDLYVA